MGLRRTRKLEHTATSNIEMTLSQSEWTMRSHISPVHFKCTVMSLRLHLMDVWTTFLINLVQYEEYWNDLVTDCLDRLLLGSKGACRSFQWQKKSIDDWGSLVVIYAVETVGSSSSEINLCVLCKLPRYGTWRYLVNSLRSNADEIVR